MAVLLAGFRGLFGRSLTVHSRHVMSCLALGAMVLAPLGTFASLGADYQSPLKTVNWAALSSSAAGSLSSITPRFLAVASGLASNIPVGSRGLGLRDGNLLDSISRRLPPCK